MRLVAVLAFGFWGFGRRRRHPETDASEFGGITPGHTSLDGPLRLRPSATDTASHLISSPLHASPPDPDPDRDRWLCSRPRPPCALSCMAWTHASSSSSSEQTDTNGQTEADPVAWMRVGGFVRGWRGDKRKPLLRWFGWTLSCQGILLFWRRLGVGLELDWTRGAAWNDQHTPVGVATRHACVCLAPLAKATPVWCVVWRWREIFFSVPAVIQCYSFFQNRHPVSMPLPFC